MSKISNVVFGKFAEVVLRTALINTDRAEDVIVFPDDLSCGPLKAFGVSREIWMRENLLLLPNEWEVFPRQLGRFLTALDPVHSKIIFWVCEHCSHEVCGFDQCIEQVAGDLYYIDTMAAALFERSGEKNEGFPPRLAHISPEIAIHLIETEVLLSAPLRAEHSKRWQKLRTENAPLRTIGPEGVQSISLSYFDPLLLAFADGEWQPAQWVVAQAAVEANKDNFFRVDMMTLTGRLRALVKEGRLVADKDIMDKEMRVCLP
jgi:hypothetical protein